ncbi:hypothetical protein HanOQP8_Chr09g0335521 [Helianthus annuus]|nr:hypothetical protein HanOQP8_Chr09g0335521 [Helianthus annuus]
MDGVNKSNENDKIFYLLDPDAEKQNFGRKSQKWSNPRDENGVLLYVKFCSCIAQGKVGPLSSALSFSFKSWWKPSFSFSVSAIRERGGKTSLGFGVRVDNVREASYQRADPNFVMLTPNKEHLAEGIQWKSGQRPLMQSDVNSGNFDGMPRELRPLGRIL